MAIIKQSKNKIDRRSHERVANSVPLNLIYKIKSGDQSSIRGITLNVNDGGFGCKLDEPLTEKVKFIRAEILHQGGYFELEGFITWLNTAQNHCGIRLNKKTQQWGNYLLSIDSNGGKQKTDDRRERNRRKAQNNIQSDRRSMERRYIELIGKLNGQSPSTSEAASKPKAFLRNKATTYNNDVISKRREWIETLTDSRLKHIGYYSEDPSEFRGKIESPIGVAHIPLGLAGPLKVNGEHARGTFFVPMATTEGALITSYTFGSHIITRSGGTNVKILKDELKTDPTFVFKTSAEALVFSSWLENNFLRIKQIAEKTSSHLNLKKITPLVNGRRVIANFHYHTGDAMGMNMVAKATDAACSMIRHVANPEEFWLYSNYSSIKKTTASNFINGYGKSVMADVTIPRKILEILNTSPEEMERHFYRILLGTAQGVLFGVSAHLANAMTAIAIACGQDAALVGNTHGGVISCEVTRSGDLYFSVYIPSLFSATVGGGTAFGTSRECLDILGCYGNGKSEKLAEIIAATCLAGEISIMTAVANETYIYAHETFGRNKPH